MATSPAVAGLKSLRVVALPAANVPVHESPVVRTAAHAVSAGIGSRSARRQILPVAGFALEKLGHAIEYLADEYVHEVGRLPVMGPNSNSIDPQVQAMQLLMAANREVYYECPVVAPLYERLMKRFFGR